MTGTMRGAVDKIVTYALRVTPSDQLLAIFDETSAGFMENVTTYAIERDIEATFIFLPKVYQEFLSNRIANTENPQSINVVLSEAILEADVILNALDAGAPTSALRGALIDSPRKTTSRFAHMPGITDDILSLIAASDFKAIHEHAELLAWGLGCAEKAELVSRDHRGKEYRLEMMLDGWNNEPLISSGTIEANSWGNLPPGEVFCCPGIGKVNGSCCINGSVAGSVLSPTSEFVVHFEQSVLTSYNRVDDGLPAPFVCGLADFSRDLGDLNWNRFAEFGIGLNPVIQNLTGNALYDEKAAFTAHVAIGDNAVFGGSNKVHIHEDLVTKQPDVILDGQRVIEAGSPALDKLQSMREGFLPNRMTIEPQFDVGIRENTLDVDGGTLYRRLVAGRRTSRVAMYPLHLAKAAEDVIDRMKRQGSASVDSFLEQYSGDRRRLGQEALEMLNFYRCLRFISR